MNNDRLVRIMMYVVLGGVFVVSLFDIWIANKGGYEFGGDVGTFSIHRSKTTFIVYQIWLLALSLVGGYAYYKKAKGLFLITILLLMFLFFYPKMMA